MPRCTLESPGVLDSVFFWEADLRKTERKCSAIQKSINKGVEVAEGKGDSLSDNRGFSWVSRNKAAKVCWMMIVSTPFVLLSLLRFLSQTLSLPLGVADLPCGSFVLSGTLCV